MFKGSPEALDLAALSPLAPELAATLVSIASDIALVVDNDGVIRHMAVGEAALAPPAGEWVGRPWVDTVSGDTRLKIEQLLREAVEGRATRRREVNHPSSAGPEIPVAWSAIRLGADGPVLAVGRDLRAVAAIQQRFVEAQQEIERDYWKRRQAEARYRLLFQVATDAVLVVDGQTLHILEANRSASQLFGQPMTELVGQPMGTGIDPASRPLVDELLVMARSTGRAAEVRARLAMGAGPMHGTRPAQIDISATPFRAAEAGQGDASQLLLVRARAVEADATMTAVVRQLAEFVERTPEAIVITDSAGRIQLANPAFLALGGLDGESHARGRLLADMLGDEAGGLNAVLAEVRRQGIAARHELRVQTTAANAGDAGGLLELSATLLAEGDQECIGFTLRAQRPRLRGAAPVGNLLAHALGELGAQLDAQLGQQPLPQLVAAAARLAEEKLIELALQRCGGDVKRAAALLGVSVDRLSGGEVRPGLSASAP